MGKSHYQVGKHVTNQICCMFLYSERPYLTEAGTEAIDHVMQLHTLQLAELAHVPAPPIRSCHMIDLVCDTQNILLGLPAHYYTIDKVSLELLMTITCLVYFIRIINHFCQSLTSRWLGVVP